MKTNGFALLEVLIAEIVWAFGMVGVGSILLLTSQSTTSSYFKQQASQSAYDIIDRMRANRQAAINGNYNVSNLNGTAAATSPSVDCSSATCTASQIASYDTWLWLAKDVTQLPSGTGAVTVSSVAGSPIATVKVQWNDSIAQNKLGSVAAAGSSANLVQLQVQTRL